VEDGDEIVAIRVIELDEDGKRSSMIRSLEQR
jgi:predicted RNA-binding protein with RPS1 domain